MLSSDLMSKLVFCYHYLWFGHVWVALRSFYQLCSMRSFFYASSKINVQFYSSSSFLLKIKKILDKRCNCIHTLISDSGLHQLLNYLAVKKIGFTSKNFMLKLQVWRYELHHNLLFHIRNNWFGHKCPWTMF